MITNALTVLFERDIQRLKAEIELYNNEDSLWILQAGISNSAGNLCLHLLGNLNHFIGAQLGNTGYVRNREAEFSLKNVPRSRLVTDIENCRLMVKQTLQMLTAEDLAKEFEQKLVFDRPVTTEMMLMHLSTHLTYHLGQINYHRRLLDH